jgi:hypothetical protein
MARKTLQVKPFRTPDGRFQIKRFDLCGKLRKIPLSVLPFAAGSSSARTPAGELTSADVPTLARSFQPPCTYVRMGATTIERERRNKMLHCSG